MSGFMVDGNSLRGAATSVYRSQQKNQTDNSVERKNLKGIADGLLDMKRKLDGNIIKDAITPANMKFKDPIEAYGGLTSTQKAQIRLKQLKYNFKKISNLIRSSKTSASAKGVVIKAKAQVINLQKKRGSKEYDPDELEMAINHALAIERVAKKHEKNLETEENARRGINSAVTDPETLEEAEDSYSEDEENREDMLSELPSVAQTGTSDKNPAYEMTADDLSDQMSMTVEDMEKYMSEAAESLQSFAEGELMDMSIDLIAYSDGFDEDDLKQMIQRHRSAEEREIAKADMQYLKDYLEYLQDKMDGGKSGTTTVSSAGVSFAPAVQVPSAIDVISSPQTDTEPSEDTGTEADVSLDITV